MRTCMYCGRELGEGEKCDCSASRARRGETFEQAQSSADNDSGVKAEQKTEKKTEKKTRYSTGYAGGDNRFERARDRYRAKRAAKKDSGDGFFSEMWHYIVSAVKNPVDSVTNPRSLGKGAILLIAALAGAVMWLSVFFIARGGTVGPLRLLASAMGFGEGWSLIAKILAAILSGAVAGVVVFFLYSGIFYLINRFVMRMKTPYWSFCERLTAAWIPFTVICLIGSLCGLFSAVTLTALLLCGAAVLAALTFEGLKTEWISYPPSKVLIAMMLGYFVFFVIMGHLIIR